MRKILPTIVLLSVLAVLVAPAVVSAQTEPIDCCKLKRAVDVGEGSKAAGSVVGPALVGTVCALGPTVTISVSSEKWGIYCLINTINTVVDWVFTILVVLAVLFALLGAYNYLTSAGSPEKTKSGRDYILYAAIGLAVAFIARAIPSLVKAIMGY